jgi:hypothetical protein
MVVTGAADIERARISRLVYLDAFVPKDGQSVMDLQPPERVTYYHKVATESGDGWKVPPPPAAFWKLKDAQDLDLTDRLSASHPLSTLEQKVSLSDGSGYRGPRAFIWASGFQPSPFVKFAKEYKDDTSWTYREIDSGHMMMISHPEKTAAVLAEVA